MSGSRGEANFVWKCKNCKVRTLLGVFIYLWEARFLTRIPQRESTASIKTAPKPYEQKEPPTRQTIIEFDCRGLEFTEFHSEVSHR
jgi:hypothetical protein